MKICPRCGSVLADNEQYCENCGYDSDFDFGGFSSEYRLIPQSPSLPILQDWVMI